MKKIILLSAVLISLNVQALDVEGMDKYGYTKAGYDINEYDFFGFDEDGYNKYGCTIYSKDRDGFNCNNNLKSFDDLSFDEINYKLKRTAEIIFSSPYKNLVFNEIKYNQGLDSQGYSDSSFDRNGMSFWGFDINGQDEKGCNVKDVYKNKLNNKDCSFPSFEKDSMNSLKYKYERAAFIYQEFKLIEKNQRIKNNK